MTMIEIIFAEMFAHFDIHLWGISCEYLPGWPEPTEEQIIRLCLCHTSYLHKFFRLHKFQTKKNVSIPEAATRDVL